MSTIYTNNGRLKHKTDQHIIEYKNILQLPMYVINKSDRFRIVLASVICHIPLPSHTVEPLLYDHPQNHIGVVV